VIYVTRLDDTQLVVNADLIITVEKTPDTVITLTTGGRIMVKDSVESVVEKVLAYRSTGREVRIVDTREQA
jgi:flagellar protein FlbD